MKPRSLLLTLAGCGVLAAAVLLPGQSAGQTESLDLQMQQMLADLNAQQTVIAENQAKIDDKLATIGEEIRVARIFVSRAGGKTK